MTYETVLARFGHDRFCPGEPQPPGETVVDQFVACFDRLDDQRTGNTDPHDFHEPLIIGLRRFFKRDNGPPSHHAFSRLFGLLDPVQAGWDERYLARPPGLFSDAIALD